MTTTPPVITMIMQTSANVSIESLQAAVNSLDKSVTRGNLWYLILLGATAVLTVATVVASIAVVKVNAKLGRAQRELSAAKDDALERFKAESKERTEGLINEAEQARLKQRQLESIVEWRKLSPEQLAMLRDKLSRRPAHVEVLKIGSDSESLFFAAQLASAFRRWTVSFVTGSNDRTLSHGLSITGPPSQTLDATRAAFSDAGVPFSVTPISTGVTGMVTGIDENAPPPAVVIMVGVKPRPEIDALMNNNP